jgi:hypothetical protein
MSAPCDRGAAWANALISLAKQPQEVFTILPRRTPLFAIVPDISRELPGILAGPPGPLNAVGCRVQRRQQSGPKSAAPLAKLPSSARKHQTSFLNGLSFAYLTCEIEGKKMALLGYARVSTQDQDFAGQIEALKAVGAKTIYREKLAECARTDHSSPSSWRRSSPATWSW